jgi:hypothetical protein
MRRENGRSMGNGVVDSKGRKLEHSNGTNTSTRIYLLPQILKVHSSALLHAFCLGGHLISETHMKLLEDFG